LKNPINHTKIPKSAMTTASLSSINYTVKLQNGRHEFLADEPLEKGGADTGPGPDELLEAALASCTAVTLRMYAQRKQWPVAEIEVTVSLQRVEKKTVFTKSIKVNGSIDEAQRKRMLEIGELCPVSRTLLNEVEINGTIS
jgi:putative redox protein